MITRLSTQSANGAAREAAQGETQPIIHNSTSYAALVGV